MITLIWICFLGWASYKLLIFIKGLFKRQLCKKYLNTLTCGYGGEVAVLKYVLDNPLGSVTWIPFDNAAMLSLYGKERLKIVNNISSIRKGFDNVKVICYPYCIPEYLRKYIASHRTELEEHWGDVFPCAELRHCQHN